MAEQGVYPFGLDWPVGAKKGAWSVSATEKVSGGSDTATWTAR